MPKVCKNCFYNENGTCYNERRAGYRRIPISKNGVEISFKSPLKSDGNCEYGDAEKIAKYDKIVELVNATATCNDPQWSYGLLESLDNIIKGEF